jgi:hypothetical protein
MEDGEDGEEEHKLLWFPTTSDFIPQIGRPVISWCRWAVRRLSGSSLVRSGSALGHPVHRMVVTGPILEPHTGRDSGVAPVLTWPCARPTGV